MQDIVNTLMQVILSSNTYVHALAIIAVSFFVAIVLLPLADGMMIILTRKTKTDVDDRIRAALKKPLFNVVILIGFVVAVPVLHIPLVMVFVSLSLLYSLIIIVISRGVLTIVKIILTGAVHANSIHAVNEQTLPLFKNVTFTFVLAVAVYALFIVWGIDVTAWIASAGILGIAVGFAAKDTLSNLISGVFILTDKPYSVGDYVLLQSGVTGIVNNVGLRSTRIRTFDDEEVTIPNGTIANEALTNKTTGPDTGRVKVSVGVAYDSDPRRVEEVLLEIAKNNDSVLEEPTPSVNFTQFGDSALDFQLSCRVKDPLNVFGTKSELRYAIYEMFKKNNIEIPFPQRDIHINN